MKKLVAGILMAAVAFSAGTVSLFAAEPAVPRNFVDANNDGLCDYCGAAHHYVDADKNGVCDYRGEDRTCGRGFVDADNNGVCDNAATRSHHQQNRHNGAGSQRHCRGGRNR